MTESKPSTVHQPAAAAQRVLSWHGSLQFKLGLLFAGLMLLLAAIVYSVSQWQVREERAATGLRYEQESALRLGNAVSDIAAQTQLLANALAALSMQAAGDAAALRKLVPELLQRSDPAKLIISAGVWPQPAAGQDRASLYWLRDEAGSLKPRADYNDPRVVTYTGEPWYTPARYALHDRCYWSPLRRELLARVEVVSCTVPLHTAAGFTGVVTISLGIAALNAEFARASSGQTGYSLLIDRSGQLLATSAGIDPLLDGKRPRNLAELAQRHAGFAPVASAQHRREEAFIRDAVQSPLYDAAQVSAMQSGTREASRREAESALAVVWNTMSPRKPAQEFAQRIALEDDAVFQTASNAAMSELPQTFWTLIRVTPAVSGSGDAPGFTTQMLILAAALLLTLALVVAALRTLLIQPLRRMTQQLSRSGAVEEALHLTLDEAPRNELGALAHWHNERIRQLRELIERNISSDSQLASASDERRNLQDLLSRISERSSAALQAITDGVVTLTESGCIEDMNPVAEQLGGIKLRQARGQDFAAVFRLCGDGAQAAPLNLVEHVLQRGVRVDHVDGIRLVRADRPDIELQISLTPLRDRQKHVSGVVAVFRPVATKVAAIESTNLRSSADPLTGLPMRAGFDRRVHELLAAAKAKSATHAVLFFDLDRFRRINDPGDPSMGDEVLVRIAEALVAGAGKAGEVFRPAADHYLIVLEKSDAERALALAERLRETVARLPISPVADGESPKPGLTASVGVAVFDASADNPAEVLRRAEAACGAAKRAGRNRVRLYEPNLDRGSRQQDDSTWIARIRRGIDHDLFHLTTQWMQPAPQHAAEGQVFEIQLALEDEEGFWAQPAEFMPAAERYQLVQEMDRWVIAHTLLHLSGSPALLERLGWCSIRLSLSTIADGALLEFIAQAFQTHESVPPQKLCFEIDESVLGQHPLAAQNFCGAMRRLGCRISVGQFSGREISDLALIRQLPLDYLSIDASQFRNMATDTIEQMLAESTLRIARALEKRIIVSGISDLAQLEAWKRRGSDYLQGTALAKTTPVIFNVPVN